jgi:hypothetical protein
MVSTARRRNWGNEREVGSVFIGRRLAWRRRRGEGRV